MHIPDGYLSPQSCAAMYGVAIPCWVTAGRRVRRVVTNRYVPLLATGAAFSFLVMMFNVPIPDGTTAHAVGAVLVAVLLGPWAAVVAVSTALLIQALFFGDGGVLSYSANCVNMAVIMPFAGYAIYRLVAGRAPLTARRRAVAAGVGGYVGLNVAALAAAIELGVQPSLFATSDATPLYAPFGLSQTIPAMLVAHLLVAGVVEAVVTFGVIAYLQRANLPVLQINTNAARAAPGAVGEARPLGWRWALAGLGTMAVLTPLGLLAPGGAFGEDAPGALDLRKYHLDAAPRGLRHYAGFFHNALFDGYGFRNDDHPALGYLVSAAFGLLAIWIVILAISQFIRVVQRRHSAAPRDPGAIVS